MIKSRVSTKDEKFLQLALNLARRHVGLTGKNPSVGCVITYRDIILGRGTTQLGGRPHAEIMAIKISVWLVPRAQVTFRIAVRFLCKNRRGPRTFRDYTNRLPTPAFVQHKSRNRY